MHWCPLKRSESLTDNQSISLRELLAYNLESVRAYKCTVAVMSRFVLNAMPGETRTLRGPVAAYVQAIAEPHWQVSPPRLHLCYWIDATNGQCGCVTATTYRVC